MRDETRPTDHAFEPKGTFSTSYVMEEPKEILRGVSSAAYKFSQMKAKEAEADEEASIYLTDRITQKLIAAIKTGGAAFNDDRQDCKVAVAFRHPFANRVTECPSLLQTKLQQRILDACRRFCPAELTFATVQISRDFAMYRDACDRCCGVICCPCIVVPFVFYN